MCSKIEMLSTFVGALADFVRGGATSRGAAALVGTMSSSSTLKSSSSALLLAAIALLATGCASVTFAPKVESVGDYKDMRAYAKATEDVKPTEAKDVRVIMGALPEGMRAHDGVLEVDHERYEVLGKVSADLNNPLAANMGVWVYDYKPEERWRLGYCAWQVPLTWVTLGLWAWVSPLHYPCKAPLGDDEERKQEIISTLQRATKALGGNMVVVGVGGTTVIDHKSGVVSEVGATNGVGFAVRDRSAGQAPKTKPVRTTAKLP